jgi:peptide subunit release factor 1 (eRF1)
MSEKKEMSQLARQILSGGGHVTLFTQQEFDEALALGKAEIMQVAVQTTKQAIQIERQACSEVCKRLAEQEDEGELSTALVNASIAIINRMQG